MDVFKTKAGTTDHIPITEENYERETRKEPPFVQESDSGKERYFAICPECDNPIQLVALYKQDSVVDPYGRHHKGAITGLADYDEEEYLNCPYSNPDWSSKTMRRAPGSKKGAFLRRMMREQFDRVVYIWNATIPIRMSKKLAEEQLRLWRANEGWRNYDASYGNLSYNLMLAHKAISIVFRWVRKDSALCEALSALPDIFLDATPDPEYLQIKPVQGRFVRLSALLGAHRPKTDGTDREETFTLFVCKDEAIVYEEAIEVQQDFLQRLIDAGNEDKRDRALLEIADEVLG